MSVSSAFADADVERLQLSRQGEEVLLKIDASGSFQFSHQIVEAKGGKPFRVIVDIFPAVHNLGQKSFYELPASVVKSIRTSQFAVTPTKMVRVVLDLKTESAYRIEKINQSIFVYIPDSKASQFPVWSSRSHRAPISGKVKLISTADKRSPIAQTDLKDKPATDAAVEVNDQTPGRKTETSDASAIGTTKSEYTYHKPERSTVLEQDISKLAPSKGAATPPVGLAESKSHFVEKEAEASQLEKESTGKEQKRIEKPAESVTAPSGKVEDEAKSPTTQEPSAAPKFEDKPSTAPPVKKKPDREQKKISPKTEYAASPKVEERASKEASKPVKASSKVVKPKAEEKTVDKSAVKPTGKTGDENKSEPLVMASAAAKSEGTKKPTSRFRRQPSFPAKLKGTIVAEFPKRMVIKYTPGISRDPFASLIDQDKKVGGPLEKKIANIETSRLVGILESAGGQNRALLEDIDGFGFILKPGDKVKKGYVSQIYSDKALFQIFEYGWSRSVALHLNENE